MSPPEIPPALGLAGFDPSESEDGLTVSEAGLAPGSKVMLVASSAPCAPLGLAVRRRPRRTSVGRMEKFGTTKIYPGVQGSLNVPFLLGEFQWKAAVKSRA